MEFSDMEHYALDILLDKENPRFTTEKAELFPGAALMIQKKYKEIMIDEYQDTNGVQELITALISNSGGIVSWWAISNNRFMLSAKQTPPFSSINTMPSVMRKKP